MSDYYDWTKNAYRWLENNKVSPAVLKKLMAALERDDRLGFQHIVLSVIRK